MNIRELPKFWEETARHSEEMAACFGPEAQPHCSLMSSVGALRRCATELSEALESVTGEEPGSNAMTGRETRRAQSKPIEREFWQFENGVPFLSDAEMKKATRAVIDALHGIPLSQANVILKDASTVIAASLTVDAGSPRLSAIMR